MMVRWPHLDPIQPHRWKSHDGNFWVVLEIVFHGSWRKEFVRPLKFRLCWVLWVHSRHASHSPPLLTATAFFGGANLDFQFVLNWICCQTIWQSMPTRIQTLPFLWTSNPPRPWHASHYLQPHPCLTNSWAMWDWLPVLCPFLSATLRTSKCVSMACLSSRTPSRCRGVLFLLCLIFRVCCTHSLVTVGVTFYLLHGLCNGFQKMDLNVSSIVLETEIPGSQLFISCLWFSNASSTGSSAAFSPGAVQQLFCHCFFCPAKDGSRRLSKVSLPTFDLVVEFVHEFFPLFPLLSPHFFLSPQLLTQSGLRLGEPVSLLSPLSTSIIVVFVSMNQPAFLLSSPKVQGGFRRNEPLFIFSFKVVFVVMNLLCFLLRP